MLELSGTTFRTDINIRNTVPFTKRRDGGNSPVVEKRADARRNQKTLLDAAAAAFIESGVNVPVRDVALRAGVGVGTIYRHFPTRADLIVAVYHHQIEACAEAGPALLANSGTAYEALAGWIDLFVDFLVTKHGLAEALVCASLIEAAAAAGEIRPGVGALELMRGVGNLCIGDRGDRSYDARRMVGFLIAGLRSPRR
jgi:AcrR family transcriptional regulator